MESGRLEGVRGRKARRRRPAHAGVEVTTDDRTTRALVRIPGRFDEWQHTGDIGRIDDDGFVWIEGRVSDMINRGGNKVHPSEVEEVLRLAPRVADAAVGRARRPLGGGSESPSSSSRRPTDEALDALCREHLAPYRVPVRFERVTELPATRTARSRSASSVPPVSALGHLRR